MPNEVNETRRDNSWLHGQLLKYYKLETVLVLLGICVLFVGLIAIAIDSGSRQHALEDALRFAGIVGALTVFVVGLVQVCACCFCKGIEKKRKEQQPEQQPIASTSTAQPARASTAPAATSSSRPTTSTKPAEPKPKPAETRTQQHVVQVETSVGAPAAQPAAQPGTAPIPPPPYSSLELDTS